jgi:acetyltransferase-like isoleucine patch superfamily enzyme
MPPALLSSLLRPLPALFYPYAKEASPLDVFATVFLSQKILGINRAIPWPVHFTSRVLHGRRMRVGRRSFPGWSQGCYIQARNGIEIGHNLRMGPHVGLISANHDPDDYDRWLPAEPIRIGDNVWIGMNSVVMPGVRVGNNVVIGANSVVTHDLPDNVVAVGSPCRAVREKAPYQGHDYAG